MVPPFPRDSGKKVPSDDRQAKSRIGSFARVPACWVVLVLLVLAETGLGEAAIYRYVDPDGVIHFTNVPTHMRYRLYIPETRMDFAAYFFRYDGIIQKASAQHGVDFSLIKAVIKAESDFDRTAVSDKGARGLMQLMPQTAQVMAVTDPFDPQENIHAGVRYLKYLLASFQNNVPLALAAYNAGENAVRKYGRIPPYEETRTFVDRVLRYWDEFKIRHKTTRP
jgi:soluble lytic murein transglycosylase-like protein